MSDVRLRTRGQEGAVLVLALLLLTVGMIIIATLTYSVSNDLQNSRNFAAGRSIQYAESSAVSQAIQSIRYTPLLSTGQTLNASPPSYCWGSGPTSTLSNIDGVSSISVWCSTTWNPTSTATRVVTISACASSASAASCAQDPGLRAVVTFDDYPSGTVSPTTGICVAYCGSSMSVGTWDFSAVVPAVTSLSTQTGPVTGGTSLTITGSGFVSGATVNFVEEYGGTPTGNNNILPATSVTYVGPTSITATTPAIVDGANYFVTVTTPTGTSSYSTASTFTYQPTTPTISNLSTTTGDSAGGSSLVITGTGFTTGAQVTFTEESGGKAVSPAVTFTALDETVNSGTQISAITPAVTAATTFFVTVTTAGGTSTQSTSFVFSFFGLIPTVSSVSPSSGSPSGGTTITVQGTGFVTGSTVQLVPTSGHGNNLTATTVTVDSATTLTCITPSGTANGSYYVDVTNPTGSSYQSGSSAPTFTYT